jgi:hypothetical protein
VAGAAAGHTRANRDTSATIRTPDLRIESVSPSRS